MNSALIQKRTLKRQPTLDNYGFVPRTYLTATGRRTVESEPPSNDRFTVWHLNISGLWNKLDRLKMAIYNTPEKPDVIGLCETHLSNSVNGIPPDIRGYNCFHNNCTSQSAGTAIYYNARLPAEEIEIEGLD